jgi:putative nucleotidyltransferase with HDIG domain
MSPELNLCAPTDSCLLGHCRRVAAVAQCIAHQMFLAAPVKVSVESAALLHHSQVETLPHAIHAEALVPALLRAFRHAADAPEHLRRLAEIIHIANGFDELYERRATEPRSPAEIVAELRRLAEENSWSMDPVNALENVARATDVGVFSKSPLPLFPRAALRLLPLLDQPESAGGQADRIAATVFRPLFSLSSMRSLLQHALEAAELAHHLAAQAPAIDREDAFLCGLLHDIGKLLIDRLNLFDSATMRGLLDHGCPPVYAENLLIGCDHGKAGGDIAAYWRLPARYVEAIRCHHQPERIDSPLAHLLYLVEWRLGHLEDMPSAHRVGLCMGSTGVAGHSLEAWHNSRPPVELVA